MTEWYNLSTLLSPDLTYGSDVVIIEDTVKLFGQIEQLRDELLEKIN